MWYVLFGGGGEDVLIPIAVYSVYIRGPPIQKFGDGTDCKAGTTKERLWAYLSYIPEKFGDGTDQLRF